MSNTPTLSEVLRTAIAAQQGDIFTALPARVESYDSTRQKVTVQPLLKRGYKDEADERQAESLPAIPDVPVAFPGAGIISITWPIASGATGLLIFTSGSLDKWKSKGGEVDPGDDRRNTLSDAVFIPGLRPFSDPVDSAGVHATAMVIVAPLIHAGGSAQLATKADIDALESYIGSHVHTGVTPGTPLQVSGTPLTSPPSASGTQILKGA
jgi:hypothetical protein